jgi:hypothetical protein
LMCSGGSKILLNSTSVWCCALLLWLSRRPVPQFVYYSLIAVSE